MFSSLVLVSVLATHPAREFATQYPRSSTVTAADGQRLVHASAFSFESGARRPEDAAARFLDLHGVAFGVTPRQVLVLTGAPGAGEARAVRFARTIDGLPVFGGDLVVGVDSADRVFVVNSADVPPAISGRHALGEARARSAALASFPGGVSGPGPAAVAAGWRALGPTLRAVYRVELVAEEPPGDWRIDVDAETGKALFREDLRSYASAPGSVFEVSPVETAASACGMAGTGHSFCATPVTVTLPNLSTGLDLRGAQTSVYDCNGADAPTSAAGVPGPCATVAAADGAFDFAVDTSYRSAADHFAAAMAYYHLDKHVSFLKALDATIPPGGGSASGSSRALRGSLPALVNVFQGGKPYDNAFFSPTLDAMVFGQGTAADFAYDATIVYHELTHGAVFAWGGFNPNIDSLGALWEPAALNEGTADGMAASEDGRSEIGSFVAATSTPPAAFLRDLDDPSASRTCQGDGTLVPQLGGTFINGLDGEEHDDGEIWNGFYWEVVQGLAAAGIGACGGTCRAGPALLYKALQLAGGTSPSFSSHWQTFKAAATALFPPESGVADYVDCVAKRRGFDKCDRTVPVYAGESKAQYIVLELSPFQVALHATGATQFRICSAQGTTTTVYARKGVPVQIDPVMQTVTSDWWVQFARLCSGGSTTIRLPSAGTWYLLLDSPGAWAGAALGFDVYRIDASSTGMASRPASTAPPDCAPPFLTVTPDSAIVQPSGSATFAAHGGSGAGYGWSLAANASGGSVAASGAYTAGPTAGVVDVVQVTDSLGNVATGHVTVIDPAFSSSGPAVSISPATGSTPPNGTILFTASGGSGTGFTWSIAANASGAVIDGGGTYTAGPTGGVTDVVAVRDSVGHTTAANVTVTAPAPSGGSKSSGGGGCGCGATGRANPLFALGLPALLRCRRKRARYVATCPVAPTALSYESRNASRSNVKRSRSRSLEQRRTIS